MKKIVLCSLLIASLLGNTAVIATTGPDQEGLKETDRKESWVVSKTKKAYAQVKNVPQGVWWTLGGTVVIASLGALAFYLRPTGAKSVPSLPKSFRKEDKVLEDFKKNTEEYPDSPLRQEVNRLIEAVKDLETETYGTTFLKEDKIIVDGSEIYVTAD